MDSRDNRALWAVGATAAALWLAREAYRREQEVSFRGKVALITGGSRGLGLCIAKELVQQGCPLALCARDDNELYRAKEQLEALGGEVAVFVCDVTNEAQVNSTVHQVIAHYGRVDLLFNNAGQISTGPAPLFGVDEYKAKMESNFYGALHFIYALLPHFRNRRTGRIINVCSLGGRVAVPHLLPYSCSKFALTALSEGLRSELRRDGIKVTTIIPGTLRTGSHYQTQVIGEQEQEFANFSLTATMPVISTSAENAAHQIVIAAKRGEAERTISWNAKIAALFHGVLPGATADLFGMFNEYVLPAVSGETELRDGKEVAREHRSPLMSLVSKLGKNNAERLNQFPTYENN